MRLRKFGSGDLWVLLGLRLQLFRGWDVRRLYWGDEAVSASWQRFDEPRICSPVSQRISQLVNRGVQTVIEIDERVRRPQALPQVFARYDLARFLQQRHQHLERLFLHAQFSAV